MKCPKCESEQKTSVIHLVVPFVQRYPVGHYDENGDFVLDEHAHKTMGEHMCSNGHKLNVSYRAGESEIKVIDG